MLTNPASPAEGLLLLKRLRRHVDTLQKRKYQKITQKHRVGAKPRIKCKTACHLCGNTGVRAVTIQNVRSENLAPHLLLPHMSSQPLFLNALRVAGTSE